jgi:hypothetical protein
MGRKTGRQEGEGVTKIKSRGGQDGRKVKE